MKIANGKKNQEKSKGMESVRSKPSESLSREEIEELMGINRQTYKRINGAVRRR